MTDLAFMAQMLNLVRLVGMYVVVGITNLLNVYSFESEKKK